MDEAFAVDFPFSLRHCFYEILFTLLTAPFVQLVSICLVCGGGGRVSFKRMKRFIDALDIAYGLIGLPVIEISGFGFQMNQTTPIKSQSPDIILKTVRCWCVHVRARSVEDTGREDEESERADPGGSRVPIKPVKAAGGSRRRWTRTTRLDGACCVVISVLKLTTNAGQCRAGGDKSKQQTRLCVWKRNAFNRLNTIQYNTIPGYHGRLWVFIGAASPDRLIRRQSTNSRADVGVVEPSPFREASRSRPIEVFKQLIANRRHLSLLTDNFRLQWSTKTTRQITAAFS
ncbi:Mannosylglycerate synthase [Trichinella spiralis]|uniref:Mannosylglycerate synthase n=1 Tax=Trichinella spiralis TaxID=6334 RepID=A0ABR3L274_TRISP